MFNASWFFNRIHRINQSWTIALTGFQFRSPSLAHLSFKPLSLTAHSVHRDVFTVRQLLERCAIMSFLRKKLWLPEFILVFLIRRFMRLYQHFTPQALHTSSCGNVGAIAGGNWMPSIRKRIQNHIPFKRRRFPDFRGIGHFPELPNVKNHKVQVQGGREKANNPLICRD